MKHKKLPDIDVLEQHLEYHPDTGAFMRKIDGNLAGCVNKCGYTVIYVAGRYYYAHRLAYKMFYRKDPGAYIIDHRNCDRSDNRIDNLRRCRKNSKVNARNQRKKGRYVVDEEGVGKWVCQ
jgi:hypothetical protein